MRQQLDINYLSTLDREKSYTKALNALPSSEQEEINRMATKLIDSLKKIRPQSMFSRENALEIIAAIGIGISQNKIVIIDKKDSV